MIRDEGNVWGVKCLKIMASRKSATFVLVFMSEMYSVAPGRLLMVA